MVKAMLTVGCRVTLEEVMGHLTAENVNNMKELETHFMH